MSETLFQKACTVDSLRRAWYEVKQKGARGGIDGITISQFDADLEANLRELSESLIKKSYIPEPYQQILIPKDDGSSERRALGLPSVGDKIVQGSVIQVIEPIFEEEFLDCSYGYRKDKGSRKAIGRVNHYLGQGHEWVTICDIDKFFDSIDHELLLNRLREKISDADIIWLIGLWLKMGHVTQRLEWKEIERGVPQGAIISPLLSNIYLHPFDKAMTGKDYGLVRYADDFVLLTKDRWEAKNALYDAQNFLTRQLKLRLNPNPIIKHFTGGFVFLGIYFKGGLRSISHKKFNKIKGKIESAINHGFKKPLLSVLQELNEEMEGWSNYYGAFGPEDQLGEIDNHLLRNLSRLLRHKYQRKEIKSQKEEENILQRLLFLSPKNMEARARLIANLVRESMGRKPAEAGGTLMDKQNMPSEAVSSTPEQELSHPPPVEVAVSKKRRQYQKLQAKATDLIVSTPGVFIGKHKKGVVIRKKRQKLKEVSSLNLKHILILTEKVSLSGSLIKYCAESKIPLDFVGFDGQPYARLVSPLATSSMLGLRQLEALVNGKGKALAAAFVQGKIRNQINLLKYYHKYRKERDKEFADLFLAHLSKMEEAVAEVEALQQSSDYEEMRGKFFALEGRAATYYWELIKIMLDEDVVFEGRERQGATDLVNSLLNYGYGMLYPRIHEAIILARIDPHISFLHKQQGDKPTLVFDLVEEFRPQAVDRVVFSMITKGEKLTMEGERLAQDTKRKLVENVLERLNVRERFRGQTLTLNDIIRSQGRAMAKFLEGSTRSYRPYIAKW